MDERWKRPTTAKEVAAMSESAEAFGRNLRDWQHELAKVTNRKDFAGRIEESPPAMRARLGDAGQCDAYLAAYVEWLCERHGVPLPEWLDDEFRRADKPWHDHPPLWMDSFVHAPGAFRRRGVFTRPEDVLRFRRGRPPVSDAQKRRKSAERQRRYRIRLRERLR